MEDVILVFELPLLGMDAANRNELAKFLRARRESLAPELLGFTRGRRRRTPGLRREEVCSLAFVGLTWYTWLEQGRDIRMSSDSLKRIAKALRLSAADMQYVLSLAGHIEPAPDPSSSQIDAVVQGVLDGFKAGPAMVFNASFDFIAFNSLADIIYRMDDYDGPFVRNLFWRSFMDPKRRRLYANWETASRNAVGLLRAKYATHVGDPEFESLIKALLENSEEFNRLWNEYHAASLAPLILKLNIPRFGSINVYSVRMLYPNLPEHTLVFLTPADTKSVEVMKKLGTA